MINLVHEVRVRRVEEDILNPVNFRNKVEMNVPESVKELLFENEGDTVILKTDKTNRFVEMKKVGYLNQMKEYMKKTYETGEKEEIIDKIFGEIKSFMEKYSNILDKNIIKHSNYRRMFNASYN